MASIYSSSPVTTVGAAPTGDATLNSLLSGTKWGGGGLGWGANVTFSFPTSFDVSSGSFLGTGAFNYSGEADTGQALDEAQQAAARNALQRWANVANLTFTEIADTPDTAWWPDGDNSSVGDIRFAESDAPGTAWAYYPSSQASGGDVWFNKTDYNNPGAGSFAFASGFMHEIGHALGLEHPHENDDGDTMGASTDALKYSIMSYKDHVGDTNDGVGSGYFPTTPMLYDVLAMQTLYGANWNYNSGNNTYSWTPGAQIFECIWDGGGIDTLTAANQTQSVDLHLTSGVFNTIGSSMWNENAWVRDNLVIAYDCTIENATGSAYDDGIYGNTVSNVLSGGAGNDTMRGSEWADHWVFDSDVMYGGAGNDFMGGHNGDDSMYGDAGNDSVIGDAGNDYLRGGVGNDWIVGDYTDQSGNGNDSMYGDAGSDTMEGGTGNDFMVGGENTDVSTDYMYGQDGNDTMYGGAGDDTIYGGNGTDWIYGQNGNDVLSGDVGNNYLDGGEGNDSLNGSGGADSMVGGNGNDTFVGGWNSGSVDTMNGGAGNDVFHVDTGDVVTEASGGGDDAVVIYSNNYTLAANVERLTFVESASVITGTGNSLNNIITGNSVANTIDAGTGADTVYGGNGNDTIWGAISSATTDIGDTLYGQGGNDVIGSSYGHDVIDGGIGNDSLYGDEGNDIVRGGDGNDLLRGDWGWGADLSGADTLDGGNGNDSLYGGGGNDTFTGGAGTDTLNGGNGGNDMFLFTTPTDAGNGVGARDVITDFQGAGLTLLDLINVNAMDANTGVGGNQNFSFIGTGAFSAVGQLHYVQVGGNTIIEGNLTGTTGAEFQIQVNGLHTFVAGDFLL